MKIWLFGASVILNLLLFAGGGWLVYRLGGPNYLRYRLNHDGVSGVYEHRKNILRTMPIDTNSIIFLGNSLTAYYDWHEAFDNPDIKNHGIAGEVVSGVLERLPSILDNKPAKIFLMIGINDLIFTKPDRILQDYEKIVHTIHEKAPPTKLYIQSVLPVNGGVRSLPIKNSEVLRFNAGIAAIANKYKDTYIDLHPLFCDEEGRLRTAFTKDGIHLDAPGYEVWREALRPYLQD